MALTAAGALALGGGVMFAGGASACDDGRELSPANRVDTVNGIYLYYGGDPQSGGYIGLSGDGSGYAEAEGTAGGGGSVAVDDGGFLPAGGGHYSYCV